MEEIASLNSKIITLEMELEYTKKDIDFLKKENIDIKSKQQNMYDTQLEIKYILEKTVLKAIDDMSKKLIELSDDPKKTYNTFKTALITAGVSLVVIVIIGGIISALIMKALGKI